MTLSLATVKTELGDVETKVFLMGGVRNVLNVVLRKKEKKGGGKKRVFPPA